MTNETKVYVSQLIEAIKRSPEYGQYRNLLSTVKLQPELYDRSGQYRRRSLQVQTGHGYNVAESMAGLNAEFQDLQDNRLANEFMAAEHQYVRMIQQVQDSFLEQVEIDVSFLEG